jgi:hypothetical protein
MEWGGVLNADRAVFQPAGEDASGTGEVVGADGVAVEFELVASGLPGTQRAPPFDAGEPSVADTAIGQIGELE